MPRRTKKPGQREYEAALKLTSARKPDFARAYKLLCKAEQLQHEDATYALATWHLFGRHFAKNLKKGIVLLKRATRRGSADAAFDLAIAYERGEVIEKNSRRAFEFFMTAAIRYDREQPEIKCTVTEMRILTDQADGSQIQLSMVASGCAATGPPCCRPVLLQQADLH